MKVVVIDNYDSFTYNIVQCIGAVTPNVLVFKNDEVTIDELENLNPSHLVISAGPGLPKDAGVSLEVIEAFKEKCPLLGVCLGFQAMALLSGAKLKLAPKLFHGKTSKIEHTGKGLFKGIQNPFIGMRYHSWIIEQTHLFLQTMDSVAWTEDKIAMAIQHKRLPFFGVQFHPESILTTGGRQMIRNFLTLQ